MVHSKPYIVEGEIDGVTYKWVRIKVVCSNENFNVLAKNLNLKMLNSSNERKKLSERTLSMPQKKIKEGKPITVYYKRMVNIE
jgi:ABC-type Zn uptake system ZnuABC Zn-binding protein ZnuA